ncbi:MAG TPA: ABC transporter ATP-binding protein [Opitutaceae bacterium]|nr:ABC transporter ATP-binding protein [Opitutaceae bacterium]HND61368.1 ABC transporter ATP-binding protein [Opitutaceae bacterium]
MSTAPKARADLGLLVRREPDEDGPQFKPLEWGLILRLFTYTRPFARKRNALIVLTLIRSIQIPAITWAMGRIISGPIAGSDLVTLPWAVLGFAALAVVTDAMFHFRQRYALELGEQVVNALRSAIFDRMQSMPMSFFHRTKLGRILSRVTTDVEAVRSGIQDVLFVSVIQFGQMLFAAVAMAWCDWLLFLVVLALAPILWLVNNHFRMRLSQASRAAQESFSRVTSTLAESVNGMRVTQGFVRQETNLGLFRTLLADHSRYNIEQARTSAILTPLLELNSQFFIAMLLLLGGWRTFHGAMTIGDLIQFFFLANLFFSPIATIGNQYNQALIAMAGAERVFRLIDAQPDWTDDPAAAPLPAVPGRGVRVEFQRVTFGYDPGRPVLHDVSFTAEPGQTIALVGHTGSGKSSIINLVAKFYLPTGGELRIDGREIRTLTSHSLHRQMGMVQQQNFLFTGTVLENIRLSRPEATLEEVWAAARHLDCLDLLEDLPQGFDTVIGERGAGLSVGQRQLVCFTRALLADPRLVILDEATSAIDALTEARLQKALVALLRGRTSFVVAHRLSTIRHADQVLVLEQGRVIEHGTHLELLALGGHYAALYQQFVQVDDRA